MYCRCQNVAHSSAYTTTNSPRVPQVMVGNGGRQQVTVHTLEKFTVNCFCIITLFLLICNILSIKLQLQLMDPKSGTVVGEVAFEVASGGGMTGGAGGMGTNQVRLPFSCA